MEIKSIESFLSYYERTRTTTSNVIKVIPPDKLDWSYMPGKFTVGDLVRHIAGIERYVFAEVALGNKPAYTGCKKDLADGFENVLAYYNQMRDQSVAMFKSLSDDDLKTKTKTLDGKDIEIGNFLRALFLHEVHHRGAMCIYLNLLGVQTPPVIGLMEEQVIQLSK
ncbi:MAG: DinB family protein [Bacteroidota bacterium]